MEISGFIYHPDITWNQFWSFWCPKHCHFFYFSSFRMIFGNYWHIHMWNFSKNQNSKPPKLLKQQFLTFWSQPKLISLKFIVARKKIAKSSHYGISTVRNSKQAAQVCTIIRKRSSQDPWNGLILYSSMPLSKDSHTKRLPHSCKAVNLPFSFLR